MDGSVTVDNAERVIASLQRIDRKTQRKTVRRATTAAGKVTHKTTQRNARAVKQTGFTARSLKTVTRSRKGFTTVRIGQAKRRKFKARKSNRARGRNLSQIQRAGQPVPIHWIERGTKAHFVQAKRGGVLAFQVGRRTKKRSGLAFVSRVRVPGMRPRHLLRKSARQSRRLAAQAFITTVATDLNNA